MKPRPNTWWNLAIGVILLDDGWYFKKYWLGRHWFSWGDNFPCYPLVQSIFIFYWLSIEIKTRTTWLVSSNDVASFQSEANNSHWSQFLKGRGRPRFFTTWWNRRGLISITSSVTDTNCSELHFLITPKIIFL